MALIRRALIFAVVVVMTACSDYAPSVAVSQSQSALTTTNGIDLNGIDLNGIDLNGIDLNGIDLNGIDLNGIDLNGIDLNGIDLNGIDLNGTSLNGIDLNGTELSGLDFIGANMTGLLSDGRTITLRIDDIQIDPTDHELYRYSISVQVRDGWTPLCGFDANHHPVTALPLKGRWNYAQGVDGGGDHIADPNVVTFACQGFVLAKCVEVGYKPWHHLGNHHQACTRLLRADYCGDGTPHTENGTLVNLYDGLGIQRDTERWPFEAEWTTEGARCASKARIGGSLPACVRRGHVNDCGSMFHFWTGTLLMNESKRN